MSIDSAGTPPLITTTCPRVLARRSTSLARRMLDGAGLLSVMAYREQPQAEIEALAHGRGANGDLVFVVRPRAGSLWAQLLAGDVVNVRVDITLGAPTAGLKIVTASTHGLATLSFLPQYEVVAAHYDESLPELVAMVGELPGARVARIQCDRFLVHDSCGVTPVDPDDVPSTAGFPGPADELGAADVVQGLGPDVLADIIVQVLTSERVGTVWAPASVPGSTVAPIVDLLDVDAHGFTLARLDGPSPCTVFVPFDDPVDNLDDLAAAVAAFAG